MGPEHKIVEDDLLGIGSRIKTVNPYFVLAFNRKSNRYEIHDTHPSVKPNHSKIMVIMRPDGEFRIPDSRDLDNMRELTYEYAPDKVQRRLDVLRENQERNWQKQKDAISYLMAGDLLHAGRVITPSVEWRERAWVPGRRK